MANEAEIIQNPTAVPAAVSASYARQNTRAESSTNGLDLVVVEPSGADAIVRISGPIDFAGVLYNIKADVTLTPAANGRWWIAFEADGSEPNNYSLTLTDVAPVFNPERNAHYTAGGARVLNTSIFRNAGVVELSYYDDNKNRHEVILLTNAATWVAPFSKWYEIWVCGRGGKGGDVTISGSLTAAASGGGALVGMARAYIPAGQVLTASVPNTSGGITALGGGVFSFQAQNGTAAANRTDTREKGLGGIGGAVSSGLSFVMPGERGGSCFDEYYTFHAGGASFFGKGGLHGHDISVSAPFPGEAGKNYGGGGGGAYRSSAQGLGTTNGAVGGAAIIRIIG